MGNEPLLDKKVCKEYEKARAGFKSNQSKKSKAKDVFEFDDDEEPIKDDSKDSEAKKDDTETENNDKETSEADQDEPEEIIEVEPDVTGEFDLLEKAKELEQTHRKEKAAKADKIMEKLLFSKKKDGRRASVSIAQPQISLQQMEQMAKGNFLIILLVLNSRFLLLFVPNDILIVPKGGLISQKQ